MLLKEKPDGITSEEFLEERIKEYNKRFRNTQVASRELSEGVDSADNANIETRKEAIKKATNV